MPYSSDINDSWDQYYEEEKPTQSVFDPEWDEEDDDYEDYDDWYEDEE
jgi:hypothetical protein